ncbi:MAG TPA: ThuA domain-containing protein [Gemmataceae bacterium]|nr:ThuA domain-containing protein [Gemmataceae bacterium]
MLGRLQGFLAFAAAAFGVLVLSAQTGAQTDKQPEKQPEKKKERDIFDYAAHKAAKNVQRIVFVADTAPHGAKGNHEFLGAAMYFAQIINAQYPNAYCAVHTKKGWPKDLKHADTIIVLLNDGGSAVNDAVKEAMSRGAGFMAIHYAVEVNKGVQGDAFKKWIGGYFEQQWSVNPVWQGEFKEIPKHETTRGVKPFAIKDEWYYHMRFNDKMEGVTPILTALPPISTLKKDSDKKSYPREGNPAVNQEVKAGVKQVVAWAYDRPDGGRGFGFTGLHYHSNLGNDDFRKLLLNAVAWVSKLEVPANGIETKALSRQDLDEILVQKDIAIKTRGIDVKK